MSGEEAPIEHGGTGLTNVDGDELRVIHDVAVIVNEADVEVTMTMRLALWQKIWIDTTRRPRWLPLWLYRRLIGSLVVTSTEPVVTTDAVPVVVAVPVPHQEPPNEHR